MEENRWKETGDIHFQSSSSPDEHLPPPYGEDTP